MRAAVFRGVNDVRVEEIATPEFGPGELLVRVHTCGICGTDLKKIATGSHPAPRVFGHEIAGIVAAVGAGVNSFAPGDRVMVFHHIPCGACYFCRAKTFAQCSTYKKVGVTAGFEPAGGGFAEYVRVLPWIVQASCGTAAPAVQSGVVKIPNHISYDQASFIEPVNTCLKAIETMGLKPGETVFVIGQGPIGIMLALLARRAGASIVTSDLFSQRLTISGSFGIEERLDAARENVVEAVRSRTEGRGADAVILAVGSNKLIPLAMDAARPGGRVLLFAQTQHGEASFDPAAVCVDEKALLGSYSAAVDLQEETVRLVFSGEIAFERLISHRFPLSRAPEALHLAANPQPDAMKIVIQPGA
jgi:L-iditol 2-dehydrogenase